MKWSNKSLGSKLQHNFFFYIIKYFGIWWANIILYIVVFYYTLRPKIQKRARPYLQYRFKTNNKFKLFQHTYILYLNFARVLLQRMTTRVTRKFILAQRKQLDDKIAENLSNGKGCIILSAHLGAWQLGLAGLEASNHPINILYYRTNEDVDTHYFESYPGHNIKIITVKQNFGGLIEATKALQNGEIVCIMGDRLLDQERYVTVPFLGSNINLPITAYALSAITQTAIIISFSIYEQNGIQGVLGGVLQVPVKQQHDSKSYYSHALEFAQAMEKQVQEYPYQFFNFYDMWVNNHD